MAFKTVGVSACLLAAFVDAKKGTENLCIGPRSHVVTYDIDGESLEQVENATISVIPDITSNALCGSVADSDHHGDHAVCVGANADSTCAKAKSTITMDSYFDCPSCFVGLTTDLFYKLNVKFLKLEEVEVGIQNSHVRGAAEIHAHARKSVEPLHGKITLHSDEHKFKIHFVVAGIIPVSIAIALPTTFNYALALKGSVDATAGADLDLNLGNHYMKYTKGSGFSVVSDKPTLAVTPKFAWDVEAEADLSLGLESTVAITIEKVISYNLNLAPSMPVKVDLENKDTQVCASGSADFVLSHEADVHFTLFGKNHDVFHYGPKQLDHYHKDDVFHKCLTIPTVNSTIVV